MKHDITRNTVGRNESAETQLLCLCGWKGEPIAAWNDYRETLLKDQEGDHLRAAHRAERGHK